MEGVAYVNYHEDEEAVNELNGFFMNQLTLFSDGSGFPLVSCGTPPGLYGLMKKIGGSEPPWGGGFFDLLVADEASMMRLPELFLSDSFLCKSSQIIVAGNFADGWICGWLKTAVGGSMREFLGQVSSPVKVDVYVKSERT